MIPWLTFLAALAVIFVLAQQLRRSGDREAENYRRTVDLLMRDRDQSREEAHALRCAFFPPLARFAQKTGETSPEAQPVEKPAQPARPMTMNDKVNAILRNARMPWRQKAREITRVTNVQQERRDSTVATFQKAEQASVVETSTKETPA